MTNMRYSALDHYVIVTGLGDAVREELTLTPAGEPQRLCLAVPGEIAWDACECGQLAVSTSRIYPSRTFPSSAADDTEISRCGVPYMVADITISVTRCVSSPEEDGTAPPCSDLFAETLTMYEDGEAALKGAQCYLKDIQDKYLIAEWTMGELTYVGPQGQCAGISLNVKIAFTAICCG